MKPRHYFNDTWQMNFHYFLGWKWEDFAASVLKEHDFNVGDYNDYAGRTYDVITKNKKPIIIIWSEKKNSYAVIAHECLHAANWTLERAGVLPSFTNDETQAYLMTAIMQNGLKRG